METVCPKRKKKKMKGKEKKKGKRKKERKRKEKQRGFLDIVINILLTTSNLRKFGEKIYFSIFTQLKFEA